MPSRPAPTRSRCRAFGRGSVSRSRADCSSWRPASCPSPFTWRTATCGRPTWIRTGGRRWCGPSRSAVPAPRWHGSGRATPSGGSCSPPAQPLAWGSCSTCGRCWHWRSRPVACGSTRGWCGSEPGSGSRDTSWSRRSSSCWCPMVGSPAGSGAGSPGSRSLPWWPRRSRSPSPDGIGWSRPSPGAGSTTPWASRVRSTSSRCHCRSSHSGWRLPSWGSSCASSEQVPWSASS